MDGEIEKVLWNHLKPDHLLVRCMCIGIGSDLASLASRVLERSDSTSHCSYAQEVYR